MRGHFRPEFINRIDEFIIFEPLQLQQIKRIVVLQVWIGGGGRPFLPRPMLLPPVFSCAPPILPHAIPRFPVGQACCGSPGGEEDATGAE